jgi:dipeptidyl aminopeptidase/acylaminoacyl peptidase
MVLRDLERKSTRLALFDTDMHELATLASGPADAEPALPAWSPDGQRLLYSADDGGSARLFSVDLGSGQSAPLSQGSANSVVASWSPDGKRITFGSDRDGVWQVYVMDVDGGTRRWRLPPGSLTFVFTLNALLVSFLNDRFALIPAALAAGIIADVLVWRSEEAASVRSYRLFAFAVPAVLYAAYFAALSVAEGIAWSVPLWSGSIVLAGVTGWLLSYLAQPSLREMSA